MSAAPTRVTRAHPSIMRTLFGRIPSPVFFVSGLQRCLCCTFTLTPVTFVGVTLTWPRCDFNDSWVTLAFSRGWLRRPATFQFMSRHTHTQPTPIQTPGTHQRQHQQEHPVARQLVCRAVIEQTKTSNNNTRPVHTQWSAWSQCTILMGLLPKVPLQGVKRPWAAMGAAQQGGRAPPPPPPPPPAQRLEPYIAGKAAEGKGTIPRMSNGGKGKGGFEGPPQKRAKSGGLCKWFLLNECWSGDRCRCRSAWHSAVFLRNIVVPLSIAPSTSSHCWGSDEIRLCSRSRDVTGKRHDVFCFVPHLLRVFMRCFCVREREKKLPLSLARRMRLLLQTVRRNSFAMQASLEESLH